MSYRRVLRSRWSRRDRLTVLLVVLAVAFLTGTTLVVLAVGSSTAGVAAEFDVGATVIEYDSVEAANTAAGEGSIVVPMATVETPNGTATVVGVPTNATVAGTGFGSGEPTLGTIDSSRTVELVEGESRTTLTVSPRGASPFPPDWYVTDPATVERIGADGALVVEPTDAVPTHGVPLQGALAFFVIGTRSVLATLSVAAGIGAVLVGVTVYAATRITVRDRRRELFVLRAAGETRWGVRRLFLERGLLLVGTGVAVGYALGVVVTNLAVNAAVALGLPTSLSVGVTGTAVEFLLPTYGGVLVVGAVATLLAVQPVVGAEPHRIRGERGRDRTERLPTDLLSSRLVAPTAATLAAFVTFLLVAAALASVAGPLAAADTATITEPGSTHPIASQVPAAYAAPLRDRGIDASPEILAFAVRDGQPFPVRGANYTAFAAVSDAELVRGRTPERRSEAVIGTDLASTLGVAVGDELLVGGSVRPAVTRVEIVGAFDADGAANDQLVVTLPAARHLTTVGDDRVNFIRASRLPETDSETNTGVSVSDVAVPATVVENTSFDARVTVRNAGLSDATVTRSVAFGGWEKSITVTVPATSERTVTVSFAAGDVGTKTLRAGDVGRNVTVLDSDTLRLVGVPERAPPGSEPLVTVRDAAGNPLRNATVTAGNWTGRTDESGTVRVPLSEEGTIRVMARAGDRNATATIAVTENAQRSLSTELVVGPSQPTPAIAPRLRIAVTNPWNRSVTRRFTVRAPGDTSEHTLTVPPGATRTFERDLSRRPPGEYEVLLSADGRVVDSVRYRVSGDDRIVAALATGGQTGTTGIGQAAAVVFGNLELALAALLLLGTGMTVGGTVAVFTSGVHASAGLVGLRRALGATRPDVARLVLRDALWLGAAAVALALAAALAAFRALGTIGLLTAYGVRLDALPSFGVLALAAVGALAVVLLAAGATVAAVLGRQPAALLRECDSL